MQLSYSALLVMVTVCAAFGRSHVDGFDWKPPGAEDLRGPCPMLNTLANHGFLPRNGSKVALADAIYALDAALSFKESIATRLYSPALPKANPEPNATFFSLDQLNPHNVLEHDASISRSDAFFGNNHVFNQTVFDETKKYWTSPILDIKTIAKSRLARIVSSKASNPTFQFPEQTELVSLGEAALPIMAFGDIGSGTVPKNLVEYLFENERLPYELGWSKKSQAVGAEEMFKLIGLVGEATKQLAAAGTH